MGYSLEVVAELRRLFTHRLPPIILTSARMTKDLHIQALEAGCVEHFNKPIDLDALLTSFPRYLPLRWHYQYSNPTDPVSSQPLIAPSATQIADFKQMLVFGDLKQIKRTAQALAQTVKYRLFAEQVLDFAKNFQLNFLK